MTCVPPAWMGYRHSGKEMYLNRNGDIQQITGFQRFRDRGMGFLTGLLRFKIDHFADHSIDRYIKYIRSAVHERNNA